jgi:bifunctional ADP-heptose synthase (sugar kinase/adenylyltransferase)
MVLIADYGHGLMDKSIVTKLLESCKYISVNTQANAGNRGYNTISRYKGINFFTANGGELQLEMRSRNLDFSVVVPELMKNLGCRKAVLTIGGEGVIAFEGERCYRAPALAQRIVDKVGAGDSVFAISSLLAYVDTPPMIIGLLSNIVAAHEVSQLGHKQSLTIGDIRKQIRSLLG